MDQEINEVDTVGFPHVFDGVANDGKVETPMGRPDEVDCVINYDLVIEVTQFEGRDIGGINLDGGEVALKAMFRRFAADDAGILAAARADVADSCRPK
jgi:hypothetical protein